MLKGTATIELTDVNTGVKEVVKHDNLVTNAIHDLLTLNPFGMRFRSYSNTQNTSLDSVNENMTHELGASFEAGMLPVCPKAIGGILLYEDTLEEDPARYYAPMSNPLVGYSSNDVNTTTDTRRGSMNQTESGPLKDGTGYRFVFEFATNQANGVISALGLTSERGGKAGYGAAEDKVGYPMLVLDAVRRSVEADAHPDAEWFARNSYVSMDAGKGVIYYAKVIGTQSIVVGKRSLPVDTLGLTKDTTSAPQFISETVIETEKFATVPHSNWQAGSDDFVPIYYMDKKREYAFAGTFIDGDDGYIWGLQHKENICGNESGNAIVLWVKISKEDFSFEEGQWTIPAQLFPLGLFSGIGMEDVSGYAKLMWNNSIIKDGRLYALKYDRMGVYSINLENPSDVELMECDFPIYINAAKYASHFNNKSSSEQVYFNTNVIDIGCGILYRNAYINDGKIWPAGYGTVPDVSMRDGYGYSQNSGFRYNSMTRAHYGPFFLNYYSYFYSYDSSMSYYDYPVVWLRTPYLATINNLANPVEKTADKTMKITYILREEVATDESDQ